MNSLSDIFERRLLRIPDYQRGYAWKEHQVEDFWEDILQLESDRIHYTGVITLEPVKSSLYQRWEKDLWLIEGVGFRPFYVVDGQQKMGSGLAFCHKKWGQVLLFATKNGVRSCFLPY